MVEFLLGVFHWTSADFGLHPNIDSKLAQRELQKLSSSEFAALWANGDGLCTSFAIHVSEQINNNFLFYDLRLSHRASLYPDGIIVDSMARNLWN